MSEDKEADGNWDSCKMYVLKELRRMNDDLEKIDKKLDGVNEKLVVMQVKVAAISATVGIIVTAAANLIIKFAK